MILYTLFYTLLHKISWFEF